MASKELSAIRMAELIAKHINVGLDNSEAVELQQWLQSSEKNRQLFETLTDNGQQAQYFRQLEAIDTDAAFKRVRKRYYANRSFNRNYILITIAAVISLAIGVGAFILYTFLSETAQEQYTAITDIEPGGNRATLLLDDGSSIVLSEDKSGIINGEELTYDDGTPLAIASTTKATLSTPHGGQYQVTLPDGSKVWLNAASSLRYPIDFSGKTRVVELEGEAYFEVSPDQDRPFTVSTKGQEIEVLGTAFNINAYSNEPSMVTTLVNGSVMVTSIQSGETAVLKPHQQAILSETSLKVQHVDPTPYTAWQKGYFVFEEADLKTIMRQLERWYGVEVDYNTIPDRKLYARIDRNKNLSSVLYMFESTSGMKFHLKERRLTIEE